MRALHGSTKLTMITLRKSHRASPIVDINMIPLIDVSLVLLIIFMILTPFLVQTQIKVNLPRAASGSDAPQTPLVVLVSKNGEVTVNGSPTSAAQLSSVLETYLRKSPDRPVIIQADREVVLDKVIHIMDVAKQHNVAKLGIAVEPLEQRP